MIARSGGVRIDELARRSFQFITRLLLGLPHNRRRSSGALKDLEFLSLAILQQQQPMIVGDIQRLLGVLPAQMSRIIRSLESRPAPLVTCRINAQDKRKIDVWLTDAGEQALADYISLRIHVIADLLRELTAEERDTLSHLLDRLHSLHENAQPAAE